MDFLRSLPIPVLLVEIRILPRYPELATTFLVELRVEIGRNISTASRIGLARRPAMEAQQNAKIEALTAKVDDLRRERRRLLGIVSTMRIDPELRDRMERRLHMIRRELGQELDRLFDLEHTPALGHVERDLKATKGHGAGG